MKKILKINYNFILRLVLCIISLVLLLFLISCNTKTSDILYSSTNSINNSEMSDMSVISGNTSCSDVMIESFDESIIENLNKNILDKNVLDEKVDYLSNDKTIPIATRSKIDNFVFVGDIYISKRIQNAYDLNGLDGIIDKSFQKILSKSDLNIGNLECAITDELDNQAEKTYTFAVPSKYSKVLKNVGIDLFTLANNHVLDYGIEALSDTMNVLKNENINYIGAGANNEEAIKAFIKEIEGKKYAFIAASEVLPKDNWKATEDRMGISNGYDIKIVCDEIRKLKEKVDKVIVYMHWGVELDEVSNEKQQIHAHRLVDSGADLVVGSHPHVVQEIEYYNGVPIVYSLGNFIYGITMKDTILVEALFDYSEDANGKLKLKVLPGLSNYEQVKLYWKQEEFILKCNEIEAKSPTCSISYEGYVSSIE